MTNFANPVLESVNSLIHNLKHVSIDYDKIDEMSKKFAKDYSEGKIQMPEWKDEIFPKENKDFLENLFWLSTINFSFKDFGTKESFQTLYNRNKYYGSFAMAACFKRALDNGIEVNNPEYMKLIDRKGLRQIFTGNMEIPMLDERLKILNETGEAMENGYKTFYNLCKKAKFKTFAGSDSEKKQIGIVERLIKDLPYFYDYSFIDGKEVKFHKRAQLAAMIAYERFSQDKDGKEFFPMQEKEIDKLSVAADYVLPKTLRALEIIKYDESLEEKVNKIIPLEHNSREEVEIRMATVYSCEVLSAYSNFYLSNIPGQEDLEKSHINKGHIDSFLWRAGKDLAKKGIGAKSHLCKTIAY